MTVPRPGEFLAHGFSVGFYLGKDLLELLTAIFFWRYTLMLGELC